MRSDKSLFPKTAAASVDSLGVRPEGNTLESGSALRAGPRCDFELFQNVSD